MVKSVKRKTQIVTFKADATLLEAMHGIPNRSDFIREAVMMALESTCPLCRGTGTLTPNQREHWRSFSQDHAVEECGDCQELRLVCSVKPSRRSSAKKCG